MSAVSAATVQIGTFSTSITPPLGIRLQGSISRDQPAWRVMDDLYVQVLLLESGPERFVLVTCDLIEFNAAFVDQLRAQAQQCFGIPAPNLMLCPSHTHTGPPTIRLGSLVPDPEYLGLLGKKILGGIFSAGRRLQGVRVSAGRGRAERVGINRRLPTAKGIRQIPNPNGPVDPEVLVIRFDDPQGRPVAAIVNFATHPTTLGVHVHEVSADYPGRMRRVVQAAYNGGLSVHFIQGACGDVKAAAFGEDGNFREGEQEDIDRLGRILAGEVIKTLEGCRPVRSLQMRTALKRIPFHYRELPGVAELARLVEFHRRELERWTNPDRETLEGADWEDRHINRVAMHQDMVRWAEEMLQRARQGGLADHAFGDLQAVTLGDEVALLGVPGELFSEIGMQLKQRSPVPFTCVCAYTNGSLGYLPSRRAIEDGGYEVSDAYKLYGFPACFHPDTEEMLYREAAALLSSLQSPGKENVS
jgi:neutral ceramidase